jgi:LysR family transcriptional regulator, transcriptional activator of nhaA
MVSIENIYTSGMEWLNYHHLLYFYTVAREGSMARAAAQLLLTQPTLSTQIKALEKSLGETLFRREGRRLELTETGRVTFRYAEEIFGLGQELRETLKGRPTAAKVELRVGVTDVVPKSVAHALLEPVLQRFPDLRLHCRESGIDDLVAAMATHSLDVILSDMPLREGTPLKAFSHMLGESDMTFMATPPTARRLRKSFPQSLRGEAMLLPGRHSAIRRALDAWFESIDIRPLVRGEFEDTALLKVFGAAGHGVIVVPSLVAGDVHESYGLEALSRVGDLRASFYAISPERRVKHAAVQWLLQSARTAFAQAVSARAKAKKPRPSRPAQKR